MPQGRGGGRLMVQAIGTYAKVLEISALDQLEERIRILEQSPQPREAWHMDMGIRVNGIFLNRLDGFLEVF